MPVKIDIQPNKIMVKVDGAFQNGLERLSTEILADCNEYCKEDTGALIASSNTHSQPQEGKLIWMTPYAKRQYWAIKTSLKRGRTWKWCETAKRKWKTRWQQLAEEGLRKNL